MLKRFERKEGMMSSLYGPNGLGYKCAHWQLQWVSMQRCGENPVKCCRSSDCSLVTQEHEVGMASNRRSAGFGE